ncbi:hypothetical protein PARMER_00698 [Parabacteroides merdae ATCC 43184]|nr:hypothetical protein PARMER_00698 [Parabacteroides merdae ATCC 43184]
MLVFRGDIVIFFWKFVLSGAKIICFFPDWVGERSNLCVFIYVKQLKWNTKTKNIY